MNFLFYYNGLHVTISYQEIIYPSQISYVIVVLHVSNARGGVGIG
jgi:hypothetical protein